MPSQFHRLRSVFRYPSFARLDCFQLPRGEQNARIDSLPCADPNPFRSRISTSLSVSSSLSEPLVVSQDRLSWVFRFGQGRDRLSS